MTMTYIRADRWHVRIRNWVGAGAENRAGSRAVRIRRWRRAGRPACSSRAGWECWCACRSSSSSPSRRRGPWVPCRCGPLSVDGRSRWSERGRKWQRVELSYLLTFWRRRWWTARFWRCPRLGLAPRDRRRLRPTICPGRGGRAGIPIWCRAVIRIPTPTSDRCPVANDVSRSWSPGTSNERAQTIIARQLVFISSNWSDHQLKKHNRNIFFLYHRFNYLL